MATRTASCAILLAFGSICATGDPVRVTCKVNPAFVPVWKWRLAEKPWLHVRGSPRWPQAHPRPNLFGAKLAQGSRRVALRQEGVAGEAECVDDGLQSDYKTSLPEPLSFAESAAGDTPDEETVVAVSRSHLGCKTIGVDHGRKRTGVCVSVGYAPRPLPLICHDDNSTEVALQVARIVQNEGAEQIVVGFPFNSTGGEGEQAQYTRIFVAALQETCPTSAIYLWDERFSTSVAREKLQQAGYSRMDMKGLVDTVASIGILTDFFDKNGEGAEVVQQRCKVAAHGANSAAAGQPLMPVLSYKERLKQMQAAAASEGSVKSRRKKK